ncbi:hypothetical protein FACS1894178_3870 [Bacteroidia bacterium]|nr:hypothetical protein FACS1894178_3870 [Bacteroidia bacterium]
MEYALEFTANAKKGLAKLKKNEPSAFKKAATFLLELQKHPTIGTGKPEQLSGNCAGQWSRRINQKHSLVYMIDDDKVVVLLLSAYGHYDDK